MSMPVNSANANGALESLKFCSQSYYLDGELCEMLGINYGNLNRIFMVRVF